VQLATNESVRAIQGIGSTIEEISKISSAISSAVEEQSATTQEIARNVMQASTGTQEVTSNIAGVSRAASHASDAATQVLASAVELSRNSETLKAQVDRFLREVRAA
jgi:methyl-accepting chemotaxis protein